MAQSRLEADSIRSALELISQKLAVDPALILNAYDELYQQNAKKPVDSMPTEEQKKKQKQTAAQAMELLVCAYRSAFNKWQNENDGFDLVIEFLIKHPELVKEPVKNDQYLSQWLFEECNIEKLKLLIVNKIILIDEADSQGSTLLLRAINRSKILMEDFIKWLISNGANTKEQNNEGNSFYQESGKDPLYQVQLLGYENCPLVDKSDLQTLKVDAMVSPLMTAIRKHDDVNSMNGYLDFIKDTAFSEEEKRMIRSLVYYLKERYDDSREYTTNLFCLFGVGCDRTEKIKATLALIDAILNKQDLKALGEQEPYRRALHNSRLGKLFADCLVSIKTPVHESNNLQEVVINF